MANENNKRRRTKHQRQEWNPHWSLKLLYTLWNVAFSLFKIAVGAACTVILICVVCGVVFVGILGDYLQSDILVEASDWSIGDYAVEETSFLYYVDSDGKIQQLQQIYTTTDRQWASLEDIPQDLINATIAIEDKRFYEHQGVDWITTVKACVNMFFGGDSQFGGSTITQQLVKNVTDEKSVTVQRKVMEIFRAQIFEREYDKDVILEEYLNRIYLGRGCFGVKSAAAEYFGKELQSLTTAECAALISITNNPSLFNPYSDNVYMYKGEMRDGAGRNRYRQLNVLNEMLNQGYLTQAEYDEAVLQEMVFKSGIADEDKWAVCENSACGYEGITSTFTHEGSSYFCPQCGNQTSVAADASQSVYSWFVDAVIVDVATELAARDGVDWAEADKEIREYYLLKIQTGGYHIYTTLDLEVQQQVDAIYTDLAKIPTTRSENQLQSGIVVIDNTTGDVVALAGGVGEKTDFLAYNRATQAMLQTGSAQKPLSVYAPAFEAGAISPATVVRDLPISYTSGAFPKNDNRKYEYSRTILSAITRSVNAVAVYTLHDIGFEYAYSFAKYNFGLSNLVDEYPLSNGRSLTDLAYSPLALGALTVGATVREMSAAYATFANNGVYREARTYTKVYNSNGELIIDNTQDTQKILSEKTVTYMNYCLFNAANYGTGTAAVFNGQNIAGKTGTTSSNRDRWFCGYTGHYTAAVWCGFDNPEVINLTGNTSNPAARLWKMVMQPIHEDLPRVSLYNGDSFRSVSVCLDSGLLATEACKHDVRGIDRVVSANVYREDIPNGYCTMHTMVEYCATGNGVATEYCHMFAEEGVDVEIKEFSLVKMTKEMINLLKQADNHGLLDVYTTDNYVYLIDEDGDPLDWHGFNNNVNKNADAPYLVCTVHTEEAWEAYLEEKEAEEETQPEETVPEQTEGDIPQTEPSADPET